MQRAVVGASHLRCKSDAGNAVVDIAATQAVCPFTVDDVSDAGHLIEIFVYTFDGDDEWMSSEEEHGIVFEAQCSMFHGLVQHHFLHFGSTGVKSFPPQGCHLDFRVEIAVECSDEVVKSVEDRQMMLMALWLFLENR